MHIQSSVTSISWIPSEAVAGTFKLPFHLGMAHYDDAPPDQLDDLDALCQGDRFRFANRLAAWIETDGERVTGHGYSGGGMIGSTTMRVGGRSMTFAAVALPDRQLPVEAGERSVRFVQTCGGRAGRPVPRKVNHPPFVQVAAPLAWTTLSLTLNADGTSSRELIGASPFPRHWVYGADGRLIQKSGFVDFKSWSQHAFGAHSPWGDEDSPALVTEVETALERYLSTGIMRAGAKPRITAIARGSALVEQGAEGSDLYLLLDGVLDVEVDGTPVAQLGPGAVLGERALIEGGRRTATIRAVTRCKVAVATAEEIAPPLLAELAAGHRREQSHQAG
jgi:hypothetical protein